MPALGLAGEAAVRVGILATLGLDDTRAAFSATIDRLRSELPGREIKLIYHDLPGLQRAVATRELDFFIANSGFYASVEKPAGARHLVTLKIPQADDPNRSMGSAIIVRADRADLDSIADLKGKTVTAVAPTAFGGYLIAMGELLRRKLDPESYFGQVRYAVYPMQNVVEEVLRGASDAGIVRACLIEEMEAAGTLAPGAVRVLDPQSTPGFRCRHSTRLYPDWTFASLPSADAALTRKVAAALLTMPATPDGQEWSIANDFVPVDTLYRDLKVGPYAYLRDWTLSAVVQKHWPWLMFAALVLVGGVGHVVLAGALVRRRTADLRQALAERELAEAEAAKSRARIDALERAGVVGQMSSMFAHELKQPLGAISNFARGLRRRIERGKVDGDIVVGALDEIVSQSGRAAAIVDHVRDYARRRTPQRERIDLAAVALAAVELFARSGRSRTPVERELPGPAWVEGDALEIELLVLNLLKNAAEAVAEQPEAHIAVRLCAASAGWRLEVEDNGPALDDEAWVRIFTPLNSTKPDGLGLGLAIAARIAEAHGGRLEARRCEGGGVSVVLVMPALENEDA